MNESIILASNSPRRKELLRQIGLRFRSDPAHVDEHILPGEGAEEYAVRVAYDKACVAAKRAGTGIIIAADTIVVLGATVLGKPADAKDAERMLGMLSGKMHSVITGLVVMDAGKGRTRKRIAVTKVWFRGITNEEIVSYVKTGEPLDKAGAYGIQERGALFVQKIEGCYFNIVGLPLSLLGEMLEDFGVNLFKMRGKT